MPSGGGGTHDPGVSISDAGECPPVIKAINLASPNETVVKALKINDVLDVESVDVSGRPSLRVKYRGEDAGAIVGSRAAQIIRCIEEGIEYIAIINSISGGSYVLELRIKEKSAA